MPWGAILGVAWEVVAGFIGCLLKRDPEHDRLTKLEEHTRDEAIKLNEPDGDWRSNVDKLP